MEFYNHTIKQLRKLIIDKKISPEELFNYYLKKIKILNPKLNAYLTVIEKPSIDYSKKEKPLFGIPYSMKDTYSVKGVRTTAGSKILSNHIAATGMRYPSLST